MAIDNLSEYAKYMRELAEKGEEPDLDSLCRRLKEWAGRSIKVKLKAQGKGVDTPSGKGIKGIEPSMARGFRG